MTISNQSRNLFRAIAARHGLRYAKAASLPTYASFIGRASSEVCVYLYIHDARAKGSAFSTRIWIAPPHFPDDGIDRLGIAYQINVFETSAKDAVPLHDIMQRCDLMLPIAMSLSSALEVEMESPRLTGRGWIPYCIERQLFREICRDSSEIAPVTHMKQAAAAFVGDKMTREGFQAAARATAIAALRRRDALTVFANAFFADKGTEVTRGIVADMIADQFYIDAILPPIVGSTSSSSFGSN